MVRSSSTPVRAYQKEMKKIELEEYLQKKRTQIKKDNLIYLFISVTLESLIK